MHETRPSTPIRTRRPRLLEVAVTALVTMTLLMPGLALAMVPARLTPAVRRASTALFSADGGRRVFHLQKDNPNFHLYDLTVTSKSDAETDAVPQGDAQLSGALFEVLYFRQKLDVDSIPAASDYRWVFKTDADRIIKYDADHLVSGSELMTDGSGTPALMAGTLVVREIQAPEGYQLNSGERHVFWIISAIDGSGTTIEPAGTYGTDASGINTFDDSVIRAGISITKLDGETAGASPNAARSREGAEYAIRNASQNAVVVNGKAFTPGKDILTLKTDKNGNASTAPDALPYGTYEIREIKPPKGYRLSSERKTIELHPDKSWSKVGVILSDTPIRGDFRLKKVDAETGQPMAGVAFRLTSVTTGESHVIVTNEDGIATTESSEYPRADGAVNANDAIAEANEKEAAFSSGPVWFTGTKDGSGAKPQDGCGALPYDTYKLEELRCRGNAGCDLISTTVTIDDEGKTIDLGTIEDSRLGIHTTATEASSGSHEAPPNDEVTITDVVSYDGLSTSQGYKLTAVLMYAESGEPVLDKDGNAVTGTAEFTPESETGEQPVNIELDASDLANTKVVVFETLTDEKGNWVASHDDLDDEGQTISFTEKPTEENPPSQEDEKRPDDELPQTGAALPYAAGCSVAAGLAYGAWKVWPRRRHSR
jgi:hypothetical protein